MDEAYGPLMAMLSARRACRRHFRPQPGWKLSTSTVCVDCMEDWVAEMTAEIVAEFEQLLRVAAEDARYPADNVGDDNDTNEE